MVLQVLFCTSGLIDSKQLNAHAQSPETRKWSFTTCFSLFLSGPWKNDHPLPSFIQGVARPSIWVGCSVRRRRTTPDIGLPGVHEAIGAMPRVTWHRYPDRSQKTRRQDDGIQNYPMARPDSNIHIRSSINVNHWLPGVGEDVLAPWGTRFGDPFAPGNPLGLQPYPQVRCLNSPGTYPNDRNGGRPGALGLHHVMKVPLCASTR